MIFLLVGSGVALPTGTALAGAQSKARAWCSDYTASEGGSCSVEKCPCGPGLKKMKKFRRGFRAGYCCCAPKAQVRAGNRELAEQACSEYTATHGEACSVHRRNCPVGKMKVRHFGGGPRVKYSACREKEPRERLKDIANGGRTAKNNVKCKVWKLTNPGVWRVVYGPCKR
jgi:hypothetical protein